MSNWIYVKDRLPEPDEEVNVWLNYERRQVSTMRYAGVDDTGYSVWYWCNSDERTTLTVEAWQPLPEPPTEETV